MLSASGPRIAPIDNWSALSMRKTISWFPLNSRSHAIRILSNTGAASATELLITSSTSAVAVCCSSASRVSLNRRTFSIAITAWSEKVWTRAISAGENGRTWFRSKAIAPIDSPFNCIGTASTVRKPFFACSSRTSGYSVSTSGTTSST